MIQRSPLVLGKLHLDYAIIALLWNPQCCYGFSSIMFWWLY